MSPMLRGEALPVPPKEIADLRASLPRGYGDHVTGTSAGPLLMVRVPHERPDFLRDLEAAAEVVPYRDLTGFRGVVLIGDRDAMGVSPEMFRTLLEDRRQGEAAWVAELRVRMGPGESRIERMPGDVHRRLFAVFRVDSNSVRDLDEPAFDMLAQRLPELKRSAPGGIRPPAAYLVAHEDHVKVDAGPFFTELEERARRLEAARERKRRLEQRLAHEKALRALERLQSERAATPEPTLRPAAERPRETSVRDVTGPVPSTTDLSGRPPRPTNDVVEEVRRELEARRRRETPADVSTEPPAVRPPLGSAPAPDRFLDRQVANAPADGPADRRTAMPVDEPDPAFAAADARPTAVAALSDVLDSGGFRVRERIMVQGLPVRFAAARSDAYPNKVMVSFVERLNADEARRYLKVGRSVGVELFLVIAAETTPDAERVALATSLKIVPSDRAGAIRFD